MTGYGPRRPYTIALGLGDLFEDLTALPEGASAWGAVTTQLTAEGASAGDIAIAKNTFSQALNQLSGQMGVDAGSALDYAKQATMAVHSVTSAVSMVSSFISTAQDAPPEQVANMFTGVMVAAAVAAGAVSAGVGAAIVAGASVVIGAVSSLLTGPPPVATVCGMDLNFKPTIVVGCVVTNAPLNAPGSASWRRFPTDAGWYAALKGLGSWTSLGTVTMADGSTWMYLGGATGRLIDVALPEYAAAATCAMPWLVAGIPIGPPTALSDFGKHYFAAWKANKEYAFNGYSVQEDWRVFVQAVKAWNMSRGIRPSMSTSMSYVDIAPGSSAWPYAGGVMNDVARNLSRSNADSFIYNGAIRIYTGPAKAAVVAPKKTIALRLPNGSLTQVTTADAFSSSKTATSSSGSIVPKLLIGVPVAAAAGVSIYALIAKITFKQAVERVVTAPAKKLAKKVTGR